MSTIYNQLYGSSFQDIFKKRPDQPHTEAANANVEQGCKRAYNEARQGQGEPRVRFEQLLQSLRTDRFRVETNPRRGRGEAAQYVRPDDIYDLDDALERFLEMESLANRIHIVHVRPDHNTYDRAYWQDNARAYQAT